MAQPSNDHTDKRGDRPSAGQLDSMSTAELLEGMEQALYSMTEETYDAELIDAYLEALERKSPMPEHPTADESYERFRARVGELNAAVNPQSAPARRTRPGPRARCAQPWSPSSPPPACCPAWWWPRPPEWTYSVPSPAGRTTCSASETWKIWRPRPYRRRALKLPSSILSPCCRSCLTGLRWRNRWYLKMTSVVKLNTTYSL